MPVPDLFLGLDIGTSGARATVIDADGAVQAVGKAAMADFGANHRAPQVWWQAAVHALRHALAAIDPARIAALAVDGTSGTILPVDAEGRPLSDGRMYNDGCEDRAILDSIAEHAPATSAAHGATSGLAKAIGFQALRPARIVHQADWIAFQFAGIFVSDDNNALKTGYDPVAGRWPNWIAATGCDMALLPSVKAPGSVTATITGDAARQFGLPAQCRVVAGTTDGCASFLATGVREAGDGVTALGTTLTLKILSDTPIFAPQYGIYSHKLLGKWLAGGASNTGGNVLLKYFAAEDIGRLSALIDPETDSGLAYYPLANPGERFPIADPTLTPRMTPRPEEDSEFLKAILEGIADVEAIGYARLAELGAPALTSVRTVGGGAQNPAWTRIRSRRLNVPMHSPASTEAAYGSALLAREGAP